MKDNKLVKPYRIDSGKAGPRVLLTAGVHGDEYEPMLTALHLIKELPEVLKSGSVTIVPLTNESAYVNGVRYGEDGLDLARICPGTPVGTTTERVASEISSLIRESDYFIDMHTGGPSFDIYPLAGYMLHPSSAILEKQQEMALAFNLPLIWGTDYRPDGRTLSVARDANIPAIYLEFGGGTGFRMPVVAAYKKGFMRLLNNFDMLHETIQTGDSVDKYWVEDHREDSGYLQGKMPSPADGIFVARVRIGDKVKVGDSFGKVIESFSGEEIELYADIDGLVFLLRTMVKVKPGDALGGIMPIKSLNEKIVYE